MRRTVPGPNKSTKDLNTQSFISPIQKGMDKVCPPQRQTKAPDTLSPWTAEGISGPSSPLGLAAILLKSGPSVPGPG